MIKRFWVLVSLALLPLLASSCTVGKSGSVEDKRKFILEMRDQALSDLAKIKPDVVKNQLRSAPGYAVFSDVNVNIFLASFGGGYGVVHNNRTRKNVYMKMGEVGLGFGAGAKDYRAIFVFHDAAALKDFIAGKWTFGGHVDAAAKAGDKGAAVAAEALSEHVSVYLLTETGLALQATVKGVKFWQYDALN